MNWFGTKSKPPPQKSQMSKILRAQQNRLKKKSKRVWIIGLTSTIILIAAILACLLLDVQSYAERLLLKP